MYPKKIKLEDKKLLKLLTEKGDLIKIGIGKSEQIEKIEEEMNKIDQEIQVAEKAVDISEFLDEEKELTKIVEDCISKMGVIKDNIYKKLKENVDSSLYVKYESLDKEKSDLEEERNKIALKAQKYNDKIIPFGRKLMSEYIADEFEDYESLKVEDGEIVATIFNHLEEFKNKFRSKK